LVGATGFGAPADAGALVPTESSEWLTKCAEARRIAVIPTLYTVPGSLLKAIPVAPWAPWAPVHAHSSLIGVSPPATRIPVVAIVPEREASSSKGGLLSAVAVRLFPASSQHEKVPSPLTAMVPVTS
jgi:hypothetical protein